MFLDASGPGGLCLLERHSPSFRLLCCLNWLPTIDVCYQIRAAEIWRRRPFATQRLVPDVTGVGQVTEMIEPSVVSAQPHHVRADAIPRLCRRPIAGSPRRIPRCDRLSRRERGANGLPRRLGTRSDRTPRRDQHAAGHAPRSGQFTAPRSARAQVRARGREARAPAAHRRVGGAEHEAADSEREGD